MLRWMIGIGRRRAQLNLDQMSDSDDSNEEYEDKSERRRLEALMAKIEEADRPEPLFALEVASHQTPKNIDNIDVTE